MSNKRIAPGNEDPFSQRALNDEYSTSSKRHNRGDESTQLKSAMDQSRKKDNHNKSIEMNTEENYSDDDEKSNSEEGKY